MKRKITTALTLLLALMMALAGCGTPTPAVGESTTDAPATGAQGPTADMGRYIESQIDTGLFMHTAFKTYDGALYTLASYTEEAPLQLLRSEGDLTAWQTVLTFDGDGEWAQLNPVDFTMMKDGSIALLCYSYAPETTPTDMPLPAETDQAAPAEKTAAAPSAEPSAKPSAEPSAEPSDAPSAPEAQDEMDSSLIVIAKDGAIISSFAPTPILDSETLKTYGEERSSTELYAITAFDDGTFLVNGYMSGLSRLDAQGKHLMSYGNPDEGQMAYALLDQTQVAVIDYANTTTMYSLEDNSSLRTLSYPEGLSTGGYMPASLAVGASGELYLASTLGLFRADAQATEWEPLTEGLNLMLKSPNAYMASFFAMPDGTLYVALNGRAEAKADLFRYVYDPSIASRPDKTLSVYALYEHAALRQGSLLYQSAHPDTMVDIQIGLPEGVARDDAIRTLNTELAAGRGPDVIMLDGLPVDAYMGKDILVDLGDWLKPMLDDNTLFPAVAGCFGKDGVYPAVPIAFRTTIMAMPKDTSINSLSDLAAWVQAHPEQRPISLTAPDWLVTQFYGTSFPAWKDASGTLNADLIRSFLSDLKVIYDAWGKDFSDMGEFGTYIETMHVSDLGEPFLSSYGSPDLSLALSELVTFAPFSTDGFDNFSYTSAVTQRLSLELHPMPGQLDAPSFQPTGILGVNRYAAQPDAALSFVQFMLSDAMQNEKFPIDAPVANKAFETFIETQNDNFSFAFGYTDDNGEMQIIEGGATDRATREELIAHLKAVQIPFVPDYNIYKVMLEESAGFFEGSKDLDQTVQSILDRSRIMLME